MSLKYVGSFVAPYKLLDKKKNVLKSRGDLLWGDQVLLKPDAPVRDGLVQVQARGLTMWVDPKHLNGKSLLEFYFIDVGQGDGVLVRTPEGKHLFVDGGYKRSKQPTGKNAADFVDWKFFKDYRKRNIHIDALVASHCDADHYGGLWDLINPKETYELDAETVTVDAFYHAGVSWWRNSSGSRTLGPKSGGKLTRLLGDRQNLEASIGDGPDKLQGEWGDFLECVKNQTDANGNPCAVRRLDHLDDFLPGFEPGASSTVVRVMGPINLGTLAQPKVKNLGSDSKNSNGHSVLLRFDYGKCRVLLTGDLNVPSQELLREHYRNKPGELACDVAKACHHGSDDCSFTFLQMLAAGATVISSGDSEGHGHPRPNIVAASALTGYLELQNDSVVTPLIFSTEIARSVRFGKPSRIQANLSSPVQNVPGETNPRVHYQETAAGALNPASGQRDLSRLMVVPGIVYGLVNVRTDGETILCATRNETDATFVWKTFKARF